MQRWQVDKVAKDAAQVAVQAMMERHALGKGQDGKGGNAYGKASWGKGHPIGLGRGKGSGKGKGKGGFTPCERCWSTEHRSKECPYHLEQAICGNCGKPGHAAHACRSTQTADQRAAKSSGKGKACRCCGDDAHEKKDCPFLDHTCTICKKEGHTEQICRHAGGKTQQQPTKQPQQQQDAKKTWAAP